MAIAEIATTVGLVRSRPFWPTETTEYHDVPSERPSTSNEPSANEPSANEQSAPEALDTPASPDPESEEDY